MSIWAQAAPKLTTSLNACLAKLEEPPASGKRTVPSASWRRRGEDDAGDEEDERRQAEREGRGDAQCVVDRGADVPVDGREKSRRPEDALETMLFTAPPGHGRNLLRYPVGVRVIGVIALGLVLCVAASAASGGHPALRVTDLTPFTVHGWRFNAGEHLRIVAHDEAQRRA